MNKELTGTENIHSSESYTAMHNSNPGESFLDSGHVTLHKILKKYY